MRFSQLLSKVAAIGLVVLYIGLTSIHDDVALLAAETLITAESSGEQLNPTGEPIGGGPGYKDIKSQADTDFVVSTKGELINALVIFVEVTGRIIVYSIIIRVILSWLMVAKGNFQAGKLHKVIYDITEPFMRLARKLPHRVGMLDLSPFIVYFGVMALSRLLVIFLMSI